MKNRVLRSLKSQQIIQSTLDLSSSVVWLVCGSLLLSCFTLGCDDDGLTTAQSPDYVVRPSEVVFPTLVVGLELTKEVEIENIGAADLLICLLYTSPSPRD